MTERKSRLLLTAVRKDKLVQQLKIQNINRMLCPLLPPTPHLFHRRARLRFYLVLYGELPKNMTAFSQAPIKIQFFYHCDRVNNTGLLLCPTTNFRDSPRVFSSHSKDWFRCEVFFHYTEQHPFDMKALPFSKP